VKGAYRREIDGMRGLAVLAVVLFHADVPGFAGGFVGVDVFLVISGYLITAVIQREMDAGTFTLAAFYERRVRRIMPALLAMLAASAIAAWMLLPADFKAFGASLVAISAFASNFLFARENGYFSLLDAPRPLLHSWSLAVEEQFYLLFPLLLLIVRRAGTRGTQVALAIAALLSFGYSLWATQAEPAQAFYSPASRAWEFLAGGVLACSAARRPVKSVIGDIAAMLGLALLGLALWRLRPDLPFPGYNALLPVLGTTLVLLGTAAQGSRVARALQLRPFVATGLISYSLYLWHWPMIVFGGYYVLDERALLIVRLAMAVLAFPVAWASWRFVELPFRRPRLLLSRSALFASAAILSLALASYGAMAFATKGLPSRFSQLVQRISDRGDAPDYGCTDLPIASLSTAAQCWIGDARVRPSFVLWGDSHAAVYVPELRRLARAYGTSGYEITALGCPPLLVPQLGETRLQSGKDPAMRRALWAKCNRRNRQAANFIREARPRAVILAAHWTAYAAGKHLLSAASNQEAFDKVVHALRAQGTIVYVVLDVPQTKRLSVDQIAKAQVIHAAVHIEPSTADYLRRNERMRVQAYDLQHRGLAKVIEPAQLLCGPTTCRMTDGEYPLYFDSNHLNARGAHSLGRLFEPIFMDLTGKTVNAG